MKNSNLLLITLLFLQIITIANNELAQFLKIDTGEAQKIYLNIENRKKEFEHSAQTYYKWLPKTINRLKLKIGCEIGVSFGGHSESILQNSSVEKLFSIDPYAPFKHQKLMPYDKESWDALWFLTRKRLSRFSERSKLVRLPSIEAAKLFQNESLDFVFIDGDHSYEAVWADLNTWYPKIKSGGLFCGDDYRQNAPGVRKAVDEFFRSKGLRLKIYSPAKVIWYTYKP